MNVEFSPISMIASLDVTVQGDSVSINGVKYLLSELSEMLEAEQPLPEFIINLKDETITLSLPYWGEVSENVRFPAPVINPPDGPLVLPS